MAERNPVPGPTVAVKEKFRSGRASLPASEHEPVESEADAQRPVHPVGSGRKLARLRRAPLAWKALTGGLGLVATVLAINSALSQDSVKPMLIAPSGLRATATSFRPPDGFLLYSADNVVDERKTTAWVEGVPGKGIGQSIMVTFPRSYKLARLVVRNGYQRGNGIFLTNNRVRKAVITTDSGRFDVELQDGNRAQAIEVEPRFAATRHVRLEIRTVWPAVAPAENRSTTAISELSFYAK